MRNHLLTHVFVQCRMLPHNLEMSAGPERLLLCCNSYHIIEKKNSIFNAVLL